MLKRLLQLALLMTTPVYAQVTFTYPALSTPNVWTNSNTFTAPVIFNSSVMASCGVLTTVAGVLTCGGYTPAPTFTLTTTGTSGAASYSGNVINVPQYQAALGFTPAHGGANSDITSLSGLTTALSTGQGGTGATTAAGANLNITGVTQTGTLGTSSQVSTFPGTVAAQAFTSTVATGTAPFTVTSTTPVLNLSIWGNAATATQATNATNVNGGTVSATTGTFSGTVAAGATTPSGSPSLWAGIVGSWTSGGSTNFCANQGMVNGASMAMWEAGNPPTQDGVCGATIIPSNSTDWQSDGVTGMVDSYSPAGPGSGGTAAVAGYFQARAYSRGPIWGTNINMIIQSGASNVSAQNEYDNDIEAGAGSGNSIFGIAMDAPNWAVAPASAIGFYLGTPGGASGAKWSAGFETNIGSTASAFVADRLASGANSPSQSSVYISQNASNVAKVSQVFADAAGDLVLYPATGIITTEGNAGTFEGYGFTTPQGSGNISAFTANPLGAGASQPSQSFVAVSESSVPTALVGRIYQDANGVFYVASANASTVFPSSETTLGSGSQITEALRMLGASSSDYDVIAAAGFYTNDLCFGKDASTDDFIVSTCNNVSPTTIFRANQSTGVKINGGAAILNSNLVPQVGTPTAGQAACIKSLGPPVVIGYCSTVVSSSGGCTCN